LGYDEINLNCGCPSERVQRGTFGACLMAEPQLVADCVRAMVDTARVPVTVKHRIGIDQNESYEFVRDFVGCVSEAGCEVFLIHARNAWLKGLSPRENRDVPPLRYEMVHRLKGISASDDRRQRRITTGAHVAQQLEAVDGVSDRPGGVPQPWWLAQWDAQFFAELRPATTPESGSSEQMPSTWCAKRLRMARRGPRWRGTCSGCATGCPVRAAGARSGAIIS
jgi:tRNA-dihydrouridine synthase A